MVSGKCMVLGHTVNELLESPRLYAELTHLTEEANETCFLCNKKRVIVQGFTITHLLDIAGYFRTTEAEIRKMVFERKSLYDFVKDLEWRRIAMDWGWCYSLQEFKEHTVGEDFISYLRRGYSIAGITKKLFTSTQRRASLLNNTSGNDVTVDRLVGPINIIFGKYSDKLIESPYFDFATVEVPIIGISDLTQKERIEAVKSKKRLIDKKAIEKLLKSKDFKKTGLSENYIKCDNCILTKDCQLLYKFSWKMEDTIEY